MGHSNYNHLDVSGLLDRNSDEASDVSLMLAPVGWREQCTLCVFGVVMKLLASIIVLLVLTRNGICNAQLLSAYEQAYGRWYVKLSKNFFRRWHLSTLLVNDRIDELKRSKRDTEDGDLQLLFPELLPLERRSTQVDEHGIENQAHTTTKSVSCVSCILNLEKSGKFSLSIVEELNDENDLISNVLRGEWFLTSNPYCVTDRFYDELLLVSEPRIRRSSTVEKARVELRCQVWGRYGAGAVRRKLGMKHGRVRGRMTHGSIVIVKQQSPDVHEIGRGKERKKASTATTREVVGTFTGRAVDSAPLDGDHCTTNTNTNEIPAEDIDFDDQDDIDFGEKFIN
jgi:hypothetical protein